MSKARFSDYIAQHYPTAQDLLAAFFDDAVATAADVGVLLESTPELDGRRRNLPDLKGERGKGFIKASIKTDKDGAFPALTFGRYGHEDGNTVWNPRDLAFRRFLADRDGLTPATAEQRNDAAKRRAEAAASAAAAQRQQADQERGRQATGAKLAARQWAAAAPVESHPYLTRKGVQAHGLRAAEGVLLVPMYDAAGELWNVQRIDASGEKRFLTGARAKGTFYRIDGDARRVILCEGFATGATIRQATGATVLVCFSAGNLRTIAADLARIDGVAYELAADNDASGTGQDAAEATGLPYFMPPTVGHDWNDHAAAHGIASVAAAFTPLPKFTSLAALPRLELAGRESDWFKRLANEADPEMAAARAWAICCKRAPTIPTQTTAAELLARIEETAAPLHAETVAAMRRALALWTAKREQRAMSHVTVSAATLKRHRHEIHTALPELGESDYHGVILLWAPMGSGKTRHVGRPFSLWARTTGHRFVATCHRRSLVSEMARVLDCWHYAGVSRDLVASVDAMATCLPSITKKAHANIMDTCRYLFVDEIAQVLRFIEAADACRTDDGKNSDVFAKLRAMVSAAHCIIGADAGMDDRVVRFLEECRPGEQFRIIEVQQAAQSLTAQHGYGQDAVASLYGEMAATLADGQRIWVSCESRKRVAEVARVLEATGAKVLAIDADNRGDERQARFWESPEAVSREYDAVVHSPVISSGLSIEHRDGLPHFHRAYFIGGGHSITPADAAQMMRRVRYIKAWSIAFVANNSRSMDDSAAMIEGMEAAAAIEGETAHASDFDAFVAEIKAADNAARSDFAAGLLWTLKRAGFALENLPSRADAPTADELRELRNELTDERRAAIMAAPDLTDDAARRLSAAEQRTQAQSDALTRHAIQRALGVTAVDDTALDVWADGRGPRRLDRFSAAVLGMADRRDDAEHMTQRRFSRARVAAYRALFEGIELRAGMRITEADAETIIGRVIKRRHMLAWLGLVPGKFGAHMGTNKDGSEKAFPMPKAIFKDVGEIFRAMHLDWKRRQNRHTGETFYEIPADVFEATAAHAERRNSHTSHRILLRETPRSVTVWSEWIAQRTAQPRKGIQPMCPAPDEAESLRRLLTLGSTGRAWLTLQRMARRQAA
ncbi:plasmid replication protein, CyRepA1 family [Paraburkholderia sp. A1RO-5L]|uniref:plasmid replication protein, CyRepA1 family n=1 Tax=unclassified Paraburkholderia TaxID=2615204 RepID=UPI003B772B95